MFKSFFEDCFCCRLYRRQGGHVYHLPRFESDHTQYDIIFTQKEHEEGGVHVESEALPSDIQLHQQKKTLGDNLYYPDVINAVVTLYDWNRVSHSSKAFLEHCVNSSANNSLSLENVLHQCFSIGLCHRTSFPRKDQGTYTPSSRCVSEAFTQAILRNGVSLYARVRQDLFQLQRCLAQQNAILCSLGIAESRFTPPIPPQTILQKPTRRVRTFITVLLTGYDSTHQCFSALHFTKTFVGAIRLSYDYVCDRNTATNFFVMKDFMYPIHENDSFKILSSS